MPRASVFLVGRGDDDDDDDDGFCGIVDQRKVFSLVSSRDHCQRSSPSRISETPRAGFEPAQNLSSGLVEWSCSIVITTTQYFQYFKIYLNAPSSVLASISL